MKNGATGSCDGQAASEEFICLQNTDQLVRNPPWCSLVWHTQEKAICSAGKCLPASGNGGQTDRHLCFPLGSHVFPSLTSGSSGANLTPDCDNCIPSHWFRYGNQMGSMRLNLGLALELLGVIELLECKILDFSLIGTDKIPFLLKLV